MAKSKIRGSIKHNIKRNPKLFWVYLAIVLVILYVLIYVVPSINGALKSTYTVTYGEVEIGDQATIYIARDEDVYLADDTGTIKTYREEGDMVKKGSRIAQINVEAEENQGDKTSKYSGIVSNLKKKNIKEHTGGYCQRSGVYSAFVDGYESLLSPKNMTKLNESDLKSISKKDLVQVPSRKILKGEPMFKVVSNARWYVLCFLPSKAAEKYDEYSDFKVILEDGEEISVFLYDKIKKPGKKTLVIFQTNRYYEDYAKLRVVKANIVSYTESGILLKTNTIKEEDGVKGVYVKDKVGNFVFKPIKVLAEKGDITVVEKSYYYDEKGNYIETVSTYDQVLK
ncbi:MAG: hypothetical protein MJ146_03360 [Clostridia bacterium]|nr:hypothetical protein [Clostridia bacterium]